MTTTDWNKAIRACIRIANYRAIRWHDTASDAVGDTQRGLARSAEQASLDIVDELTRTLKREKK